MSELINPYQEIKKAIEKEPLKYNDYLLKAIKTDKQKAKLKNLIIKVWDDISTLYPRNKNKPFEIVIERCRYEGMKHKIRNSFIGCPTRQKAIEKQNYYKRIQKQQIIQLQNYLNNK